MPAINTTAKPTKSRSPSSTLIADNDDSQAHVTFLRQHDQQTANKKKTSMTIAHTRASTASVNDRIPPNLLEIKQQRLLAAADRKKRMITRIISIIGLLIILLCAGIVALTLKMAPKIDELVRTKTGAHPPVHLNSRMSTVLPRTANHLNNVTLNSSSQ